MNQLTQPSRLDPAQARRLLSGLSFRPGERVLCIGPDGGPLPGVVAILVGPARRIVKADAAATATHAWALPYANGEFDIVIVDLGSLTQPTHLLTEVARVTAPTGRVALAFPQPADRDTTPVQQLAEAAGLRNVVVLADPSSEPGSEALMLVTAVPPAAAGASSAAEAHAPNSADRLRPGRLLVATAAALVLAAAGGIAWAVTGSESRDDALDTEADPQADSGHATDNSESESDTDTGSTTSTGSSSAGSGKRTTTHQLAAGTGAEVADEIIADVMESIRSSWDDVCDQATLTTAERGVLFDCEILNDYILWDGP